MSSDNYCIQLWIRPVLFSSCIDLKLIRPVLNSPTLQFSYTILCTEFKKPSLKIALRSEGGKGENKTGAKFFLYTVLFLQRILDPLVFL